LAASTKFQSIAKKLKDRIKKIINNPTTATQLEGAPEPGVCDIHISMCVYVCNV
jgi:hypothetical protein